MFGAEFEAGAASLVILAVGRLVSSMTGPVGSVLSVTGHQRINLAVYGAAAGLQLMLDLILIPQYGIVGAAVASTVAMVAWNAVLYIAVVKVLQCDSGRCPCECPVSRPIVLAILTRRGVGALSWTVCWGPN